MTRCEHAKNCHAKGYNCCQCVLAAFSDCHGMDEAALLSLGGGFGGGAGTKELCGAVTGAVMTLGMLTPIDPADPAGGKKRSVALAREFQSRFRARFNALRCEELLQKKFTAEEVGGAAAELNITGHCTMMIVAAVEIVEELLAERETVCMG